jgi:Zn finger protein HypA/HybF involved in hydrogenase expression
MEEKIKRKMFCYHCINCNEKMKSMTVFGRKCPFCHKKSLQLENIIDLDSEQQEELIF